MTDKAARESGDVPVLHPSDIYRAQPTSSEIGVDYEVVRTRRTRLVGMRWWALGVVLLCVLPPIVAGWRAEPAYLVRAVWVIAVIAAVLAVATLAAIAWFAPVGSLGVVLRLDDDGMSLGPASGQEEFTASWDDLRRCEIVGRLLPSLIVSVNSPQPERDEPPPVDEEPEPDPALDLPPIDFEGDPPPPFVLPDRSVFDAIEPVVEDEQAVADESSERVDISTETDVPTPRECRGTAWNSRFYGTPYVVSLWGSSRTRVEIGAAISDYSAGKFAASASTRRSRKA